MAAKSSQKLLRGLPRVDAHENAWETDCQGKPWEGVDSQENAWEIYLVQSGHPGKRLGKRLPGKVLGNTCQGFTGFFPRHIPGNLSQGISWERLLPGICLGKRWILRYFTCARETPGKSYQEYAWEQCVRKAFPGKYLGKFARKFPGKGGTWPNLANCVCQAVSWEILPGNVLGNTGFARYLPGRNLPGKRLGIFPGSTLGKPSKIDFLFVF